MKDHATPAASASGPGHQDAPDRRACLAQAARLLGAGDDAAKAFATDGAILVEGFALHVMAAGPGGGFDEGPWLACMKLPRPEDVSEAEWSESLLVANAHALMVQDWAFGLEDDGAGVLLMPLPPGVPDERRLAALLEGMLNMCRAVVGGATALRDLRARTGAES
jgi:hypothetical protein